MVKSLGDLLKGSTMFLLKGFDNGFGAFGYFKIDSRHLPVWQFTIKYTDAGGRSNKITTADFIVENRQLIKSKKINLYSQKIIQKDGTVKEYSTIKQEIQNNQSNNKVENQKNSINQTLIFLFIFVITATIISVGIFVYIKKGK